MFLANYLKTIAKELQSFPREMSVENVEFREEFHRSD